MTATIRAIVESCAYCGNTEGPFHYDHVVPRSRGGPDTPRNLVQACAKCNREKHDRLPSEWLSAVPCAVAAIEERVVAEVGGKIKAKRDWNADYQRRRARQEPADAKYPCYFCGGATSIRDGFLTFYDQETGSPLKGEPGVRFLSNGGRREFGELAYPGNGEGFAKRGRWTDYTTIAVLCHRDCGPDIGYWFDFARLLNEHTGLRRHVATKRWWFIGADEAFDWALAAAGARRHP